MSNRIQVTPASGTVLQGEPHEMAMQFCQQVLHPLLMALVEREGAHAVVGFYAGLVTHIGLDMNGALGTRHAEHILSKAMDAVRRAEKVPEFYNREAAPNVGGEPHATR
jgi:hypothetical protein